MTRESSNLLFLVIVGVIACATSAHTELTPYLTYTVPGITNAIQQIDLADVDGDGVAEVLAFDGERFVLHSPSADSTLFDFNLDSILASLPPGECNDDYVSTRLLLADVNRDSVTDATLLIALLCSSSNPYTSIANWRYVLVFIDGTAPEAPPTVALDCEFESTLGVGMLDAIDVDRDGYDNLVLSVDSSVWWELGVSFAVDRSFGKTLIYFSFPNSNPTQFDALVTQLWPVTGPNDTPQLFAAMATQEWQDYTGIGPEQTSEKWAALLSPHGEALSEVWHNMLRVCFDNGLGATWINELVPREVGNIITATPELEALCTFHARQYSAGCDTSESALVALEISSTNTIRELWSVETGGGSVGGFLIHPSFPDQFFAIVDDELTRFNATDGSIVKRYSALPAGRKYWAYPYGDGVPYLAIVDGQTITYYAFDEVTDVETGTPAVLPISFTLGQPYPNPFNPTVTIPLSVDRKGHLRVDVFNPLGQRVATLHDGVASPGETVLSWDASDFGSGVYLIKATLGAETQTVKAVLVK